MFHCTISIHALREEGDLRPVCHRSDAAGFLSTPSARRATEQFKAMEERGIISIHALREEGDQIGDIIIPFDIEFLSTPSARRATRRSVQFGHIDDISIHALREEGDLRKAQHCNSRNISIHALREEGDNQNSLDRVRTVPFLSTPSARRATGRLIYFDFQTGNFYPRPPRGGRRELHGVHSAQRIFLSTPSARRATIFFIRHLLVGIYFYPRPPRGGRRKTTGAPGRSRAFLSTPSARRATLTLTERNRAGIISIHALREEGDYADPLARRQPRNFYPRPPRGGRRDGVVADKLVRIFLSTPSARRATCVQQESHGKLFRFLSTPSARRAT